MKWISSYIRRNGLWMLCAMFLMLFAVAYMFLIHISWSEIVYFFSLELFLFAVVCVVGFAIYAWRIRALEESARRLKNEGIMIPGQPEAIEAIYQEIIEEISMQKKLSDADYAKKQSQMREYYSMWVHQVKTPIAAMQLLLQVQRQKLSGEDMQLQSELEGELFDIEQYVNMALQYQRVNTPGNDYVLESVRLDELVREVIRKYAKIMVRKKIPLQYEGTDAKVVTDGKWVTFVMEQVLSNAIKYSHEGDGIVIEIVREPNWYYLKITDHGIGIRKEDLARVFEKGYTGYNGHADKKSTGIGLYLCKMVLNKLGHSIRIESEYGVGTTVWIGFNLTKM